MGYLLDASLPGACQGKATGADTAGRLRNKSNDGDYAEVTGWTLLGTLRVGRLLTGKRQSRDAITLDQIVSGLSPRCQRRVCHYFGILRCSLCRPELRSPGGPPWHPGIPQYVPPFPWDRVWCALDCDSDSSWERGGATRAPVLRVVSTAFPRRTAPRPACVEAELRGGLWNRPKHPREPADIVRPLTSSRGLPRACPPWTGRTRPPRRRRRRVKTTV